MARNRWFILAVLFLARTAMAFQFQTVGSVGPMLSQGGGLDHARIGTLIGLYLLPGVAIALPGGVLGQRFGAKRVVLAGLALMTAGGLVMSLGDPFAVLAAGRLLSGVGAVLMNVLLAKMVADWFASREIVTAMALLVASFPLGLAAGQVGFAPLALAASPGAVMAAGAAAAFLCLLLVGVAYRDPPTAAAPARVRLRLEMTRREWLLVSLAGLIWGTYNVGYIGIVSFAPEVFTARGYSLTEAGWIVSLANWVMIPSVPLSGYLAERWRRRNLFMVGGFLAVAGATLALPFVASPAAMVVVIALAIGLPAGIVMALPAEVLRPTARAAGMGVYFTWYYATMAALPGLAGLARDRTGSPAAPLVFAAAMMATAAVGVAAFRLAQRRRGRESAP